MTSFFTYRFGWDYGVAWFVATLIDILLIARETADAHDNAALRADLEMLWRRIASLNARPRPGTMRA